MNLDIQNDDYKDNFKLLIYKQKRPNYVVWKKE